MSQQNETTDQRTISSDLSGAGVAEQKRLSEQLTSTRTNAFTSLRQRERVPAAAVLVGSRRLDALAYLQKTRLPSHGGGGGGRLLSL